MGRLTRGQVFEVLFWLAFAVLAYALSFSFDRNIEIYRFNATGWPRVVILVIVLAACGQLVQYWIGAGRQQRASAKDQEATSGGGDVSVIRLAATLLLPFFYALLLDYTGFYVTTPIFIFAFLLLLGERRVHLLLAATVVIYLLLLFLFTKLFYVGLPVGYWQPFYDISNWLLVLLQ